MDKKCTLSLFMTEIYPYVVYRRQNRCRALPDYTRTRADAGALSTPRPPRTSSACRQDRRSGSESRRPGRRDSRRPPGTPRWRRPPAGCPAGPQGTRSAPRGNPRGIPRRGRKGLRWTGRGWHSSPGRKPCPADSRCRSDTRGGSTGGRGRRRSLPDTCRQGGGRGCCTGLAARRGSSQGRGRCSARLGRPGSGRTRDLCGTRDALQLDKECSVLLPVFIQCNINIE